MRDDMRKHLLLLTMIGLATLTNATVAPTKALFQPAETVSITYSDLAIGTQLFLYQDAALLPMKDSTTVGAASGTWAVASQLEQGKYKIKAYLNDEALDSALFVVAELPLTQSAEALHTMMLMTDIHVMNKQLIINEGEALQKVIEGDRKMLLQSSEVFESLLDTALKYKPEILLIPGDLTKDGERVSHEQVAAGLKRMEEAGIRCFVIPGNHDVNNPNAAAFDGAEKIHVDEILDTDFMNIYKDFGYDSKEALQDTSSMTYLAQLWEGVYMLGIDATRWYDNTHKSKGDATDSSVGYGRLRQNTLDWILDRADELRADNKVVFAMMHHQMIEHFDKQSELMSSAAIEHGDSIAQIFIEHGIHLLFTGHMHISNISVKYNEQMTDSLVEVSTGATVSYPSPYRWITTNADLSHVNINTRQVHQLSGIDDFQVFGRDEIAGRVDKLMGSITNMFASQVIGMKKRMEQMPVVGKLAKALPDSPAELSKLIMAYMYEPFQLSLLTTSEANENLKLIDRIIELTYDGYDQMIDDLAEAQGFSLLEVYVYKTEVKQMIIGMLSTPIYSVLYDITNIDTDYQNRTNDLFVDLSLPYRYIRSSLEEIMKNTDDNAWYDLQGRRYTSEPEQSGYYIHQGKVVCLIKN